MEELVGLSKESESSAHATAGAHGLVVAKELTGKAA